MDDFFQLQAKSRNQSAGGDQQAQANLHAGVDSIIEEATQKTDAALLQKGKYTKSERIAGIKVNQRTERNIERRRETVQPPPSAPGMDKIVSMHPNRIEAPEHEGKDSPPSEDHYVPKPSRLARLRELREQQKLNQGRETEGQS